MARAAVASPGNSHFERSMKYVHVSWLLGGALVGFVALVLHVDHNLSWHLPFALPVAALLLGYGGMLLVGHMDALRRRRSAWAGGVPCRGEVVAMSPSSLGKASYWRVAVRINVGGETIRLEDRYVYPHVAQKWSVGDTLELRYRMDDQSVFAFDMRM